MCGGGSQTNGEVVRSYRFKFHIVKVGVEPPCIPQKLPYAKVFDRTHGGSFALIRGRNLNCSERGSLEGKNVIFSPPCRPRKLPYVKVFDETHGGFFAFIEG